MEGSTVTYWQMMADLAVFVLWFWTALRAACLQMALAVRSWQPGGAR